MRTLRLIFRHPIAPIIWVFLTLAGIPFIIFGAASIEHSVRILYTYSPAVGNVIGNELIPSAEGGASYLPSIRFEITGEIYTFSENSGTYPAEFTNNQKVSVLYDSSNPYFAVVDTWGRMWLAGTILTGVGIILAAAGFFTARLIARHG